MVSLSVPSEAHRRAGRHCLSLTRDSSARYSSPSLLSFNVLQQDAPIIPFRGRPVERINVNEKNTIILRKGREMGEGGERRGGQDRDSNCRSSSVQALVFTLP